MTTGPAPQCLSCVHRIKLGFDEDPRTATMRCKAFPDGIPDELWNTRVFHDKPYPGDRGIQFKRKSEASE